MLTHPAPGQRIAQICRGLGMKVLIAGRKGDASPTSNDPAVSRIAFDDVIRQATAMMVAMPLAPETKNLISERELALMRPDAIVINVGRGGTINEAAAVVALRERRIWGVATDVFEVEPAGSDQDSALLAAAAEGLNVTLSPHVAWCADQTKINIAEVVTGNVEEYLRGGTKNFLV
jgi:lactate dehydrogenase-like 2-hydroxyacid dehydrogenase